MEEEDSPHPLPPTPKSSPDEQRNGVQEQWSSHVRQSSQSSMQKTPPTNTPSIKRKAVPGSVLDQPEVRRQEMPASAVSTSPPRLDLRKSNAAEITLDGYLDESRRPSGTVYSPDTTLRTESPVSLPIRSRQSSGHALTQDGTIPSRTSSGSHPQIPGRDEDAYNTPANGSTPEPDVSQVESLQYHAFADEHKKHQHRISQLTTASGSSVGNHNRQVSGQLDVPRSGSHSRPSSSHGLAAELRGRTLTPLSATGSDGSSRSYGRDSPATGHRSPASRPTSYVDLLNNVQHQQQVAPGASIHNQSLQSVVGNAASLLDTKKTLEMYGANVKKTTDAAVQYEFAVFMINSAAQAALEPSTGLNPAELITEAKHILQRLADRSYPFAQYYLGDGYFSGLFNKDKPDYDKAFTLFVAASKHGHAEAGYRAALCYEFGWGTTKRYQKAVQFYRNSAAKNHPGAATRLGLACIRGDMGLVALGKERDRIKEGITWLKRAQESADAQYNAAPYELGLLHLTGVEDYVLADEGYAARLFTQSAEMGHVQANFLMGQAYETGLYGCPRDAGLSVHFYNGAASRGLPEAMMALCAWYMVGAEPVLEKDEGEAYAWATQAAETGFPKAEYAVGYFTEMGIGCRRDPLEANVWYVRAAENGNENARQRLEIIRAAASGGTAAALPAWREEKKEKKKFMGIF